MVMETPCNRQESAGCTNTPPGPIRMMLVGWILGWLIGMLWCTGLVLLVYGSTLSVSNDGGWQERQLARLLRQVPAFGIPWAIAGAIAGNVGGMLRGYGPPIGAITGLGLGGVLALTT